MGRGRSDRTKAIVRVAYGVLESEHPMTLRQCFYRLVSVEVLRNTQADYQRLSRILVDARERGEVSYEWIVDRSRPTYKTDVFKNPSRYAEAVKHSYRRDYWQSQPWHLEIWTEKDAVVGSIEEVWQEYGITVRTGRGFQSATRVHEIAETFIAIEKPIQVFYLGDHDPSGVCIEQDVARRVRWQMFPNGFRDLPDAGFNMTRLAIHAADIRAFNLPPQRVKTSDSRAAAFRRKHGINTVELDALPPSELRRRLTEVIEERIDHALWDRAIAVEKTELESIRTIAGEIGNLWSRGEA